jgi:hypothetical protein
VPKRVTEPPNDATASVDAILKGCNGTMGLRDEPVQSLPPVIRSPFDHTVAPRSRHGCVVRMDDTLAGANPTQPNAAGNQLCG